MLQIRPLLGYTVHCAAALNGVETVDGTEPALVVVVLVVEEADDDVEEEGVMAVQGADETQVVIETNLEDMSRGR